MADALVEARDFGPPTGRGMAALRAVSGGAAVLSVPVGDLVTPRRCRALLRRRLQRGAGARPAPRPFASAGDLAAAPPRFVQPLEDWSAVRDACRAAGIDSHRDAQRTALLGCALRLVSVDPSDDTAECRKVGNKTAEDTIWFPVAALLPAEEGDSSAFVNALSDENALVVALLAARGGDLLAEEYSECPGLEKIVGEVPETVGLCCEWSHPEDFEGLKGSQHYDSAVSLRADVEGARDTVKTLMTQALGGDEQAAPFCGADLDEFVWSWVRVASRHRAREAFPSLAKEEGKTLMVPGFDMFNHDVALEPGCSTKESHDGTMVSVFAQEGYGEGDEVFVSYGAKGNHELLLGYGFAIPGNPNDSWQFIFGLDALRAAKQTGWPRSRLELGLEFLHMGEADRSIVEHDPGSGKGALEVKVSLRRGSPMPRALLGLSRLEKLSDEDMTQLEGFFGREGLKQRLLAEGGECGLGTSGARDSQLSCNAILLRADALVLGGFRALFRMTLARFPEAEPVPAPSGVEATARRVRHYLCSLQVESEKAVLSEAVGLLEGRLRGILRRSLELALVMGDSEEGAFTDMVLGKSGCAAAEVAAAAAGYLGPARSSNSQEPVASAEERRQGKSSVDSATVATKRLLTEYLNRKSGRVAQSRHRSVELYSDIERLEIFSGGAKPDQWQRVCDFLFLAAHGGFANAACEGGAAARSVMDTATDIAMPGQQPPTPLESESAHPYAAEFRAKTSFWGKYLLAEFLSSGALSLQALSDMGQESVDIRNNNAWSVPDESALEKLRELCPAIQIGAGRGLWAQQVVARQAAVSFAAFELGGGDERRREAEAGGAGPEGRSDAAKADGVVRRGGPERISEDATARTLLLVWPDQGGSGGLGLECVERWLERPGAEFLVTVGEWGEPGSESLRLPGLPAHGQSFSKGAQQLVETHFALESTLGLQNWPLARDEMRVWRKTQ